MLKSENDSKIKFYRNGLLATSARISRKNKIRNTIVKQKMNVTRSLLDGTQTKQLQRYEHVQSMEEGRLRKEVMKCVHQEEENEVDLNLPGRKGLED